MAVPIDRTCFCYGYIRVSTLRQAEEGMSEEAQVSIITEYYNRVLKPRGIQWGGVISDPATSGKVSMLQREGGAKLLHTVENGDHIVIAKLDRAFRKSGDAAVTMERWGEQGVVFHMLDINLDSSTPVGRLVLGVMAHFAQFERDRISERVRDVNAIRREKGLPVGPAPYGFKIVGGPKNRRLVPFVEQRRLGQAIVRWKMEGFSWTDIYWHMFYNKIKNPAPQAHKGKEWSWMALQRTYAAELRLMAAEAAGKEDKKNQP